MSLGRRPARGRAGGGYGSRRRLVTPRRRTAQLALAGLLGTLLGGPFTALTPRPALAAGSTIFDQPFVNNTIASAYPVSLPGLPSGATGTNTACLTARGNPSGTGLHSCSTSTDANGLGALRLASNNSAFQQGGVFGATSAPTGSGLDVTFNSFQYSGSSGNDGIAFVAAAVDPASPVPPATMGQPGGGLGYSANQTGPLPGLANAYLGIGLDVSGNYSNSNYQGSGCTNPPFISTTGPVPGQVVVRGPGNGTTGYCAINSTATTTTSPPLTLHSNSGNRNNALVPVEVAINPTATAFTTDSGLSVAPGTYKVVVTPIGGTARTLTGTLPTVPPSLYPSPTWLDANGIPRQLAFGWVSSTGGSTDFHEMNAAKVVTFQPVPKLTVTQTSFNGTSPQPGDPVTYTTVPSVAAGNNETSPVSVTQTTPSGVVPAGAFGSGWVCGSPSGQSITCTNSHTPFTAGTSLPPITVVAIVTGTGVTPSLIQSSSTATVSSADANPGIATSTTAGTVPSAPSSITVTPSSGTTAGGAAVTVRGTNVVGANAIEIGTTAEQQAGTPVVLLPCMSGPAAGCFTDNGDGSLSISSMPSRATAATVTVTVVTRGVAGAASYVYASAPAAPAAPTATAGPGSATVSWTAPPANGSPITGYVITPFLNGVAQSPQSFDASTTTRTLTGLTAGGTYRFTVAAVNAIGTGPASPQSNAVVPFAVPGQPVITAAVAGDSAVTLTWTAPADGGSPITGYIVTPYIGAAAQPPQSFGGTATTQRITGLTPGTAYTFTVTAQNAAGSGTPSAHSAAVTPNTSPALDFPPPPGGQVGVGYSDQLSVSGGTAPYTWSVSAGSLPPGLSLGSTSGLISGTPTTTGNYAFTVRIVDADGQSDTRPATITIVGSPVLDFPPPPGGQVGVGYSDQLTVSGGTAPYTWSVSAGSLPPGLSLGSTSGLISGTPTTTGNYAFTVRIVDARGQSDTRPASIIIGVGPIVFTKTADTTAAPPGSVVHYTITARNTGTATFSGAAFTDPLGDVLDDATYNNDVAATSGTAGFSSPTITWSGDLAAGATATITYSVTVGPVGSGNGVLTNTLVSSTVGADCAAGSADARCRATVSLLALTISKVADAASATPGQTVHYAITVTNSGEAAYPGASFTDALAGVLDDAAYNADASATLGTVSFASPSLTWSGDLAAGGSATITYSVTVNAPDTGDKSLANAVTSAGAGTDCPSGGTDPRCSVTVPVLVPQLTITNVADVTTAVPTQVVHYTITATNTGQVAYTNATFTIALTSGLANVTYNNDATASSGSLQFNPDGTVTWAGGLAVGASVTATASVTINNPPTGGPVVTVAVTSTTAGNNCPAGGSDPRCGTTVTIQIPELTITKTANVASANPGGTVTYTVVVANTGPTAYTGAAITDSLSGVLNDAVYDNDATATTGTVAYNAPNLSWSGDLASGTSATITYSVTVKDPDPGDKRMVNTVVSTTLGNTCPSGGTNPACTAVVNVLAPGLTITKSPSASTTVPGGTVTYTITVANTGQTDYIGASLTDSLAGVLDDAAYNNDASATVGTVAYSAPTLSWSGDLAAGASATITYSVTVHSPDTGDATMANTVVSPTTGNNCPAGGTDTRCTATVRIARLLLQQSYAETTTTPGSVVHLSATFTNTGQVAYTGISVFAGTAGTVDDAIPNGDQVASSGSLVLTGTGITWTGDIPVGGVVTVTGTLTVRNPDPGDKIITGTLVSSAPGNNCPSGGTDPLCTARVDVLIPALSITKSADVAAQVPGGVVHYTTVITNSGQTPYTGLTTTDNLTGVLDDATYGNDAVATTGSATFSSPTLTWTGDLAVGASVTITYSVTINDPDTGDKALVNRITSDAVGSSCPTGSGNAGCTVTVASLTPALIIVKTADRTSAVAGQTVGYTITVTNSGQTAYTGATFADDLTGALDDGVYNNNASATSGSVSFSSPILTWTGNLAVGASATITYTMTVNPLSLGNRILTDSVTSTTPGSNCPAGGTDPRCSVSVPVVVSTLLTFTKTAGAATTTRGAVVSYTITIANSGVLPYVGANFTDPLTGVLDDATYDNNASASAGTVTYTAPDLSWSGTVPASGSVTVTYSVTVHSAPGGDDRLVNTLSSTSLGSNCPSGSTDVRCGTTVTVSALTMVNTPDVATTTPGSLVRMTTVITNTGQTPYQGISVFFTGSDLLDDVTPTGDDQATSGTLSVGPTGLTWTGDVPVGGSVTVTSTFTVNDPDTGNRHITATAVSDVAGSNCPTGGGDSRCTATIDVLIPALTITKTADTSTTVPGGTVGYTITVHNTGETAYTGISVTDPLSGVIDEAAYNNDATASAGSVSYTAPTLTWTGDVAVGATVTITYSVTVGDALSGGKVLSNTVSSAATGSTCSPTGSTAACTATVAILTPALTITKTADAATSVPGATVHYTITVTNSGQTSYPAATFTDDLSGVLDDAAYDGNASATTGTVSFGAPNLTWTGALAPAASATITYSVTVARPGTGNKILSNAIVSGSAGSNCPSGGTDPRCALTIPISSLTVTTSSDVSTTIPTGVVHFTGTITNTGQTPYFAASVTFTLISPAGNVTYNNDFAASIGSLVLNPDGSVTWTGDLPVGATAIATGSVTVNNPPVTNSITYVTTSAAPGNNCPVGSTDPACVVSVGIQIPQLTITKTADAATVTPGGTVTYTITVANTGPTGYTGATFTDSLSGVLTDAVYNGDAAATSGTVSYAEPEVRWTGDLLPGATATVTYSVTVKDPDPGDKIPVNTVTSTTLNNNCPAGSPDPACSVSVRVLVPQLTITKSAGVATVVAGGTVTYTITVANTGQTPYTGASLTDDLSGVLDDATYDDDAVASTGSLSYTAPNLGWTGDLAVGQTATITYSVTVHNPAGGDAALTNTVTSATPGSNCPASGTDTRCAASTQVIAQTIKLSNVTGAFTLTGGPGSTVQDDGAVTMTVVSNSPGGYTVSVRGSDLRSATTNDTIPISALRVRESGTSTFHALSDTTPVTIHTQTTPSAENGDTLGNDYQADIPFVPSGRYSATLDYIATTQ